MLWYIYDSLFATHKENKTDNNKHWDNTTHSWSTLYGFPYLSQNFSSLFLRYLYRSLLRTPCVFKDFIDNEILANDGNACSRNQNKINVEKELNQDMVIPRH